MSGRLKVGVVGVGHFGRHHARIYTELKDVELVGVADIDAERARAVAEMHHTAAFADHRELLGKVDAVSVAVPTHSHLAVARDFLDKGVSVLVEKPMAATAAEGREMLRRSKATGARLQVGHVTRFSAVMAAVRELEIVPRFLEVHRLSPFSFRSIDVGVVLDMMIHDIDLVLELARGHIEKVDAVGVAIIGRAEDICSARIAFSDGCVANLTASRVALKTMRRVRIFSPDSYISLDFDVNNALIIKKSEKFSLEALDVDKMKGMSIEDLKKVVFGDLLVMKEMKLDEHEPLKEELRSFVDCVRTGSTPVVPGEDGVRSLEAAEMILKSVGEHTWDR
jgi:predicted dehydrogenase